MIELKITGDNASDVMKHLAELTGGFMLTASERAPALGEQRLAQADEVEEKPRRGRKPKAEAVETVEAEPVEADAGEQTSTAADASEPQTLEESPTSAQNTSQTQPASDSDVSDEDYYEAVVTPTVLGYVRSKGKPWVIDILSEFGVERASELKDSPARLRELIDAMNERA